jgi:hypothetical protein
VNIYLIEDKRSHRAMYDVYDAHVVQASSEEAAESFLSSADAPHGDEGDIWNGPGVTCELVGVNLFSTETKIILSSFNGG